MVRARRRIDEGRLKVLDNYPVKAVVFLLLASCMPTVASFPSSSSTANKPHPFPPLSSPEKTRQDPSSVQPWKYSRRRNPNDGRRVLLSASASGSHDQDNVEVRVSPSLPSTSVSPHASISTRRRDSENDANIPYSAQEWRTQEQMAQNALKGNNLQLAFRHIRALVTLTENETTGKAKLRASESVDRLLQALTSRAFVPPYQGPRAQQRVRLGMDLLSLQLSSGLAPPYNTVPKMVFLNALRALTAMNEVRQPGSSSTGGKDFSSSYAAFRILQRLVTGVGIRRKEASKRQYSNSGIQEKDFNMVLNSFSNMGKMDMAHRIVALQERTKNAPPLSPVAYSILLKGYGRLKDLRNVVMIITHAQANEIQPDAIMLNSLIDAYINCNAISKAREIFDYMTIASQDVLDDSHMLFLAGSDKNGNAYNIPQPNRLTYNTMLKGLASTGSLEECLSLSQEMAAKGLWDDVTTNTLVHAAVLCKKFSLAEKLLDRHTFNSTQSGTSSSRQPRTNRRTGSYQHPNVEAYTELLDGYAKAGDLDEALRVMQLMTRRGVDPNEVTYTCLVAALARRKKVDQARKMIRYMKTNAGLRPSVVTYNAFISGLVSSGEPPSLSNDSSSSRHETYVDQAMKALYEMIDAGIRPNEVTLSTLILALGRCRPNTRIQEAKNLVAKLETNGISYYDNNEKFVTALVQVCGYGEDILGAVEAFQKLRKPDLIAVNTFLRACCQCNRDDLAIKTFRHYFDVDDGGTSDSILKPDVISYTIVIGGLLIKDTVECSNMAQSLHQQMKNTSKIFPDKAMVDLILKAIIKTGKLQKKDVHLVANLLRDADKLDWEKGQLERRKRAVQKVMSNPSMPSPAWKDDDDIFLRQTVQTEEPLFKKKGWNKVDSGFRLWGGGRADVKGFDFKKQERAVDEFLESHGWNDVNSGFRIF